MPFSLRREKYQASHKTQYYKTLYQSRFSHYFKQLRRKTQPTFSFNILLLNPLPPTNYISPNILYVFKTSNNSPFPSTMDSTVLIAQLISMIVNLSSDTSSVKDVLVTILNILSFLLNIHGYYPNSLLELSGRLSETP